MLKSIVPDRRAGTLQFFIGNECLLEHKIEQWPKDAPQEFIAASLLRDLQPIIDHSDLDYDVFLSL